MFKILEFVQKTTTFYNNRYLDQPDQELNSRNPLRDLKIARARKSAGGGANNLRTNLIERQNLVGQTTAGDEAGHAPDHAAGFILHVDAGSSGRSVSHPLNPSCPMPVRITASARAP